MAGIYRSDIFNALLIHECHRVERNKNAFALVLFTITSHKKTRFSERVLCDLIKKEMRAIDEIGWVDNSKIGVLLPSTDTMGGEQFAARVASAFPWKNQKINYSVYAYPDHWINSEDKKPNDVGMAEIMPEEKAPASNVHVTFDAPTIGVPAWKRAMDISFSLLISALLWPLFIAVGLYIKAISPGPIFFRQTRIGLGGKPFTFYKFRSMKTDSDQAYHQAHIVSRIRSDNTLMKLDALDPRIFPGGKFLRKTCIDELPQLYNIVRGEMSLVGPRPCLPCEAKEFLRWHNHRFDVLPGLTGLWQVSGKNKLTLTEMIRLDISYAKHMSVLNDCIIIFRTIPAILAMLTEKIGKSVLNQHPPLDNISVPDAIS